MANPSNGQETPRHGDLHQFDPDHEQESESGHRKTIIVGVFAALAAAGLSFGIWKHFSGPSATDEMAERTAREFSESPDPVIHVHGQTWLRGRLPTILLDGETLTLDREGDPHPAQVHIVAREPIGQGAHQMTAVVEVEGHNSTKLTYDVEGPITSPANDGYQLPWEADARLRASKR